MIKTAGTQDHALVGFDGDLRARAIGEQTDDLALFIHHQLFAGGVEEDLDPQLFCRGAEYLVGAVTIPDLTVDGHVESASKRNRPLSSVIILEVAVCAHIESPAKLIAQVFHHFHRAIYEGFYQFIGGLSIGNTLQILDRVFPGILDALGFHGVVVGHPETAAGCCCSAAKSR